MAEKRERAVSTNDLGKYGWLIVFVGIALNFMCSGIQVEAANLLIPQFAANMGVSEAQIYALSTPLSFVSLAWMFIAGQICRRKGAKFVMIIAFIGLMGNMVLWAMPNLTWPLYILARIGQLIGATGIVAIGYATIVANWFPTKKDLVQGWATMGSNLATALFLPLMLLLMRHMAFQNIFWFYFGYDVIILLLVVFVLRNNPEERGVHPDNDPNMTMEMAEELKRKEAEYIKTSPWTVGKLLKTKQTWLIAISMAIVMLVTVGILMTLVPTLMGKGFTQEGAVGCMTVAAVVGLVASYLWGYIGIKWGTKMACITVYIVSTLAVIFMLIPGRFAAYVSVFLIGCFIGAGNNLSPSLIQEVFGRFDFAAALGVVLPIAGLIQGQAGTVTGVPLSITGTYTLGYIILLVLNVIGFICLMVLDTNCVGRNEL